MFSLPPLPAWNSLHPLVVHIPIGVLLVAPLLVLVGALLSPLRGRPFLWAGLLLLIVGTASIYIAVETGEAGGKLVERTPQINAVLARHQELAERTQVLFSILTAALAAIVVVPLRYRRLPVRVFSTVLPLLFLAVYAAAALVLINTGHHGGVLVHELGVRAMLP